MKHNNQNTNAFLIHISAFAGFIFPLGGIITPLIAWQTLKDRNPFLDEQGKEAVNFNISYTLYLWIVGFTVIPFAFGSFFSGNFFDLNYDINFGFNNIFSLFGLASFAGFIALIRIILIIIAGLKAKEGENYKYPLTIKFIK